ncbi:MAG TPA: thioredoxin domain-containing protein [Candidatus Acidoferrales bacterium]|nr:thioredoxin domain-containing protein [Candidatus Acidoferrales bacterium]
MISHANRLIHESSPYLRQHAHNPVDWYPWGPEALERAAREDRPILLSIGYSACHWCHVMERESFEDLETASLMNDLFINIKVDREERPDLDRLYQLSHQILTQRGGGWPLTVFLTPDDHAPFFAGTYFPPEPRHGLPAFRELLSLLSRFYHERRADIRAQNLELKAILDSMNPSPAATTLNEDLLTTWDTAMTAWQDTENGGFGHGAKFPHVPALTLMLRRLPAQTDPAATNAPYAFLRKSLDAMALRGLWDHIGEGFFRYTIDPAWRIPHFEKMLYDNAQLLALYSDAAAVFGDGLYRERALGAARWALNEMRDASGGFYTSLDADSAGEEGAHYLWNREEVQAALPADWWAWCAKAWGLMDAPNFEDKAWHLQRSKPLAELARELGVPQPILEARLEAARQRLLALRRGRPPVSRDQKILTAWNALMITGLARAARCLCQPETGKVAADNLMALRAGAWRDERLWAVRTSERAHLPAYLDDYAFALEAALIVSETCAQPAALHWAIELAQGLLEHFADGADGGFFFTAHDHEPLMHRLKLFADEATPAGNAVAARMLNRLGWVLGEPRYLAAAEATLRAGAEGLRRMPQAHASLALALQEFLHPPALVVLRGAPEAISDWHRQLHAACSPEVMIFPISDGQGWPDALASKPALGQICAYLCIGTHCEAPYLELEPLLMRLDAPKSSPDGKTR